MRIADAEMDVAVVDGDDDDAAVDDTAEVDDVAVGDGDETLGFACTCVDQTGSAVEGRTD